MTSLKILKDKNTLSQGGCYSFFPPNSKFECTNFTIELPNYFLKNIYIPVVNFLLYYMANDFTKIMLM